LNALAVYKAARLLGIPETKIFEVFRKYRGSWRRMEYRGKYRVSGVRCQVFDDYAHHPTEIKVTLRAFKEKYPKSKIVCVFQPHQAERLKALFKEFQTAFDAADVALILPVYQVAGRDKPNPKFDSQALVRVIQKKQPRKLIFYLSNPRNLKKALAALLIPIPSLKPKTYNLKPVIIVMMGAGNIVDYTDSLIHKG
jgi:UDP-N-acetylmuramate--alanine ligase